MNTHFCKKGIQMSSKSMKKMLDITSNQENTNEITTSYHFITTRIARIKKMSNKSITKIGE